MKFDRTKLDGELISEDFVDYDEMNKHFIEWRNLIFKKYEDGPDNSASGELIVNFPIFDST